MQKLNLGLFFLLFLENDGETKFKFVFSAICGKLVETMNLQSFFLLFSRNIVKKK